MWRSDDYRELQEFDFTARTANCLRLDYYRWVWQIRRTPDSALLCIPNFGRKCLRELRASIPFDLSNDEQPLKPEPWEERQKLFELEISPTDWIDVLGGRENNA